MTIENLCVNKNFGGWHKQYSHFSNTLNCNMRFAINAYLGKNIDVWRDHDAKGNDICAC